jgi:putative transposase
MGLTQDPTTYRWSSYKANALAAPTQILTPHPLYLRLGATQEIRAAAYHDICKADLSEATSTAIVAATNGGWALGKSSFEAWITRYAGHNMTPRGPGRPWPKKTKKKPGGD